MLDDAMTIAVQRASDRFHTDIDWLDSKHSFNFGGHYREGDGGHGLLLVNNDDTVAAGGGFGTHGHRDMEIVTWVLSGNVGAPRQRGQPRRSLPRARPADVSGPRHPPQRDERQRHRAGALRADVGAARHRRSRSRLRAARRQRGAGHRSSWCRSRRAKVTRAPSASISATPCCGAGAYSLPARPSICRPTSTFTYSSPLAMDRLSDGTSLATGDSARITGRQPLQFTAGSEGAELLVWATA